MDTLASLRHRAAAIKAATTPESVTALETGDIIDQALYHIGERPSAADGFAFVQSSNSEGATVSLMTSTDNGGHEFADIPTATSTRPGLMTAAYAEKVEAAATRSEMVEGDVTVQASVNALGRYLTDLEDGVRLADGILQQQISDLQTDVAAADATLQRQIDDEVSARAADTSLMEKKISQEASDRAAADLVTRRLVSDEEAARAAADSRLDAKIEQESADRFVENTHIITLISEETADRTAADDDFVNKLIIEQRDRSTTDTDLYNKITEESIAREDEDLRLRYGVEDFRRHMEPEKYMHRPWFIKNFHKLSDPTSYQIEQAFFSNGLTFLDLHNHLRSGGALVMSQDEWPDEEYAFFELITVNSVSMTITRDRQGFTLWFTAITFGVGYSISSFYEVGKNANGYYCKISTKHLN